MIKRLATVMSPWIYSPQPSVRIAARATFVFLAVVVPVAGTIAGLLVFSTSLLRGLNNLTGFFTRYYSKGPEIPKDVIPHVPDSITLCCSDDQITVKNIRATDLQVYIEPPVD